MSQRIVALTIVGLALCGRVNAASLGVGNPAPKIEVKEFIKGEPVASFENGRIYVVEFWATWCPPCRTSIPHLTEMQKKYKDVVFIGVSVFENNWDAVKPFVKEMGEKMDYRVAVDGREGKMGKNWMAAAEQGGIPTAFIVNGEGKIAWIGHPMNMEKPLGQVVGGNASAGALGVGSPAPKIEVKEFIKGAPVASFDKGRIYVVEFWATWCPPCRTSIPHLTEMQKKYKDVVFIGVSVFENNWSAVKPFVQEMGEKMDYRVAMDDVGGGGREGKMSKNWMTAAEQSGIPTAFIVNGEGKIAWIGHPMKPEMEKTLGQVVAANPSAVAGNSSAPSPTPTSSPKTPDTATEKPPPTKVDPKPKVEPTPAVESQPVSTSPPAESKSKLPWIIALIVLAVVGGGCIVFAIVKHKGRDEDDDDDEDERPKKKRKKASSNGENGKEKPQAKKKSAAKRIVAEEED